MFETARGVSAPHSIAIAWYKVIKNERSDPRSVLRELAKVPISDLSRLETSACLQMTQESVIDISLSFSLSLSQFSSNSEFDYFLPPMRDPRSLTGSVCTSDHFSAGDHPIFGPRRSQDEDEVDEGGSRKRKTIESHHGAQKNPS